LPFIQRSAADKLLPIAARHPSADVRRESAWAEAKIGCDSGVQRLRQMCLEVHQAQSARELLTELGREDAIPEEASEPRFQALAEFSQWLAHPCELGATPDEIAVYDERVLLWPPLRQRTRQFLIRFTGKLFDSETIIQDVGLVGSVTFCFLSEKMHLRPPEDCYALHLCWELEQAGLLQSTHGGDDLREYHSMLKQWKGPTLEQTKITAVVETSPELGYPQRLVACAAAIRAGEQGWVVLDGIRSAWYAAGDMPPDEFGVDALQIHVGRTLLGFPIERHRKRWLLSPAGAHRRPS
jgi:hypothetical protein